MEVRIFKPAKTAMQSGRGKIKDWVMEFEATDRQDADSLIGWVGSSDTRRQVTLHFNSEQEAVAYAKKHDYVYTVQKEKTRSIKPKAYADNFAHERVEPWTH